MYVPYVPLISSRRSSSHLSRMICKRLADGSISRSSRSRPMSRIIRFTSDAMLIFNPVARLVQD
jgi:hypothetical protein